MNEVRSLSDEMLALEAHDRIDTMLREAQLYHLMVEAAPLRFRKYAPLTAARAGIAGALVKLAEAIDPATASNCG